MAEIVELPLTRDQREAKERLCKAMRDFKPAVKFAAKTGLEVKTNQLTCYATYKRRAAYTGGCVCQYRWPDAER